MRSVHEQNDSFDNVSEREMLALEQIEANPEITQRQLSKSIGIALGLTNVLIKNLAQKGYIKASQAGWKRWLYNLTPEGISHKINLTHKYIIRTISNYNVIKESIRTDLTLTSLHLESRIAIIGSGDFAELVYLALKNHGIEDIQTFALNPEQGQTFLGMPVNKITKTILRDFDKIFFAEMGSIENAFNILNSTVPSKKIVAFTLDGKPVEGS
ncbi:MAG: hypothetical protein CL763_06865 [Chloroflexi bacterium]|nr:hypothetical protein [Chloroflexota bacterium]